MSKATIQKLDNVQAMRFIAAGLVLLIHVTYYIGERVNSAVQTWLPGEIGVPIFFVISGFVMQFTSPSYFGKKDGAARFIGRRICRIIPLYWLVTSLKVAIAVLAPATVLHNHADLEHILASYILFPTYNMDGDIRPIHGVGWTLFHEMFFYYIFTVALLLRLTPWKLCASVILGLWGIGLVFDIHSAFFEVITSHVNLMFIFGLMLALSLQKGLVINEKLAIIVFAFAIVFATNTYFYNLKKEYLFGFPFEAVLLVGSVLHIRSIRYKLPRTILNELGNGSYSLYLLHPIMAPAVCIFLSKLGLTNIPILAISAILTCILLSQISYFLIEKPLNSKFQFVYEKAFNKKL